MQDYPVRKLLFKELLLGAINGLFTGLVAGAAMWWSAWHAHNPQAPLLALVIVTAMISACMLSGIFGVMVVPPRRSGCFQFVFLRSRSACHPSVLVVKNKDRKSTRLNSSH